MSGDIMRRLREADTHPGSFNRADFTMSTVAANVKDRLATVERIVTDGTHRLDSEIDALRDDKVN